LKRFGGLIVSLALLLSCFMFGFSAKAAVQAGAGNGEDFAVESVADLGEILEFVNENSDGYSLGENQRHTSATLDIETFMTYKKSVELAPGEQGLTDSLQKLDRTLKMYLTEDATYYETKGSVSVSTTHRVLNEDDEMENKTAYVDFVFDMNILRYNNSAYFYIKQFVYSNNEESRYIKLRNTYRWIEGPMELVDAVVNVDNDNRSRLSELQYVIEYFLEEGKIDSDAKFLHVDTEDFFGNKNEEFLVDYKIDCSSDTAPRLSAEMNDGSFIREKIVISNIDNTEVSFDEENIEISAKTNQAFDDLFLIEKKEAGND